MAIRIGDEAPDFTAESTEGPLHLYEYYCGFETPAVEVRTRLDDDSSQWKVTNSRYD
ncbi:hypothetical protein [Pseudomonas migulae]|uniref:Uncharacterized protein n=1 Tax=Pseudomonas migulae TaxID=78543 RepID=A0A1H5NNE9_9PSED|nr:hypothetical protein [Pseudomonas migulae]SEF02317.1 hypothetical protein SAMN04490194_6253 [Pseudomonas migulae]